MRKVAEYEEHARECRLMAANMRDPTHKQQLEEMAEAWTMLAKEREKHLAKKTNGYRTVDTADKRVTDL